MVLLKELGLVQAGRRVDVLSTVGLPFAVLFLRPDGDRTVSLAALARGIRCSEVDFQQGSARALAAAEPLVLEEPLSETVAVVLACFERI